MDDKAKAYKDTLKKNSKKPIKVLVGPNIKPKNKNGATARAPMFKKSTRGR